MDLCNAVKTILGSSLVVDAGRTRWLEKMPLSNADWELEA
jgi:hypothetical protein